jgi:sarcosine oxidase
MTQYDTIVVGLGAAGAATLYQLARRGQRVLGIDRFSPPHPHGSSHGDTRLTRCATGEGEAYVHLALRSHEIWRELEAAVGDELLLQAGMLILSHPENPAEMHGKTGFLAQTLALADRFAIAHDVLDPAAVAARFPQFRLKGGEQGYYEPGAGFVHVERCIAAQLTMAERLGATVRRDTQAILVRNDGPSAARVSTAGGEDFVAANVVVAAGAWVPGLLGGFYPRHLKVYRQVMHWFEVDDPSRFAPEVFPTFIWMHGSVQEDYVYGFPIRPHGEKRGTQDLPNAIKIGTEHYRDIADPDELRTDVTPAEVAEMFERHIAPNFSGIRPRVLRSAACMYTVTADGDFLIDRLEGHDHVLVVSACSGHGFKISAALGEAVAERVVGGAETSALASFTAARLSGLVETA